MPSSFKHNQSMIVKDFQKIALEKGLIKPPSILEKLASNKKKIDIRPSHNIMDNIFKLCAALKEQGLSIEAEELENNFLLYKKAQTLYDTHGEKGEDVIQSAHPEGSHKLKDVEGDEATVEDILDRHVKMIQTIEKKPTGKLTNANILKQVKQALGQDAKGIAEGVGFTAAGLAAWKIIQSASKFLGGLRNALKIVGIANEVELNRATESKLVDIVKTLFAKNPEIIKPVVQDVGSEVIEQAGVSSAIEGTAVAGSSGAIGGIVAWLSGLGAIGLAAAGGVASLVGGTIGYFLFNAIHVKDDFRDAGNHLINEANDVTKGSIEVANFKSDFDAAIEHLPALTNITNDSSPTNLAKNIQELGQLNDAIYKSRASAQILASKGLAQSDVGGSGGVWDAIKGVVTHPISTFSGWADVTTAANNYIRVATEINTNLDAWINQVHKIATQNIPVNSDVNTLKANYQNALKQLSAYKEKFNALVELNKITDKSKITAYTKWFNDSFQDLKNKSDKFNHSENQASIAKIYLDDFNENYKPQIEALKQQAVFNE